MADDEAELQMLRAEFEDGPTTRLSVGIEVTVEAGGHRYDARHSERRRSTSAFDRLISKNEP